MKGKFSCGKVITLPRRDSLSLSKEGGSSLESDGDSPRSRDSTEDKEKIIKIDLPFRECLFDDSLIGCLDEAASFISYKNIVENEEDFLKGINIFFRIVHSTLKLKELCANNFDGYTSLIEYYFSSDEKAKEVFVSREMIDFMSFISEPKKNFELTRFPKIRENITIFENLFDEYRLFGAIIKGLLSGAVNEAIFNKIYPKVDTKRISKVFPLSIKIKKLRETENLLNFIISLTLSSDESDSFFFSEPLFVFKDSLKEWNKITEVEEALCGALSVFSDKKLRSKSLLSKVKNRESIYIFCDKLLTFIGSGNIKMQKIIGYLPTLHSDFTDTLIEINERKKILDCGEFEKYFS